MSFVTRIFKRSDHTAKVAHERLYEVLARERTLPLPIVKPVSVTIKETFDGLIIVFGEGEWPEQIDSLAMQLDSPAMREFFEGARVRIESTYRTLSASELEDLSLLLAQHNMILNSRRADGGGLLMRRSIPMTPPEIVQSDMSFGSPGEAASESSSPSVNPPAVRDQVLLIRHSIVAGQAIHFGGTIVIFGDVSPAAEVIADRDVIVFGRLRGVVHAGAGGNEDAFIAALILAPTQVRIGGQIAHVRGGQQSHAWPAEIARVREDRIIVEPWGNPQPLTTEPVS